MNHDCRAVLVTGGASGMGAATARRFAEEGAHVSIVDRNGQLADQVAAETGSTAFVGDVADSAFCERVVADALASHGRVDVLVNAAGVIHRADAAGTGDEEWQRVMDVNVNGLFYMSRAAVAPMVEQGTGAIVNFGSIWGNVGGEGVVAYCASKGAVHQITRAMALDHVKDGVRVNAVAPGEVNTPMLASGRNRPPSAADLQHLAETTVPMQRLADPDEIAAVVLFLASDEASYMTGSIVTVDAGYTAR